MSWCYGQKSINIDLHFLVSISKRLNIFGIYYTNIIFYFCSNIFSKVFRFMNCPANDTFEYNILAKKKLQIERETTSKVSQSSNFAFKREKSTTFGIGLGFALVGQFQSRYSSIFKSSHSDWSSLIIAPLSLIPYCSSGSAGPAAFCSCYQPVPAPAPSHEALCPAA